MTPRFGEAVEDIKRLARGGLYFAPVHLYDARRAVELMIASPRRCLGVNFLRVDPQALRCRLATFGAKLTVLHVGLRASSDSVKTADVHGPARRE
ncbi:hypothetical protein ON010_g6674 [Phytophthora cinnamomi]|nr:hypothetical protein ON010_g6674 [Phytophthora cinnamomi]